MKRTLLIVLAMFMALVLAACGNQSKEADNIEDTPTTEQRETVQASDYADKCKEADTLLTGKQYERAIAVYTEAIEVDGTQTAAYLGRGNAYTALAEQETDGEKQQEDYQKAQTDFEKVVELDKSSAEAYQKLSGVYAALGDMAQAEAILESGAETTGNAGLQTALAKLQATIKAQDALASIPYYGDRAKCKMTAEQATAYAQLIADGMSGKIMRLSNVTDSEVPAFWGEDFTVNGYGEVYRTNRTSIILGDFAGDGNPYLYLFNMQRDESFTICGWHDGAASVLWDYDSYAREGSWLYENNEKGVVELDLSGTGGAASHGGYVYSFIDGELEQTYSWQEYWDYDTELWHSVENGVDTVYTQDEWDALLDNSNSSYQEPVRTVSYPTLEEVFASPATLRQMLEYLNNYASIVSGGAAKTVAIPELTTNQRMGKAMLEKLDDIYTLEYARLFDLDGDGVKELIVYGMLTPQNYYSRNLVVFKWQNNQLVTRYNYDPNVPAGGEYVVLTDELYLVRNKSNSRYGFEFFAATDATVHCFVVGDDVLILSREYGETEWDTLISMRQSASGDITEISEQDYNKYLAEYERVDTVRHWESYDTHIDKTRAELNQMLLG